MKPQLFNISLFTKYRREIDERNYKGIFAAGLVFVIFTFINCILQLVINRASFGLTFLFYDLLIAAFLVILKYYYRRSKYIVNIVTIAFYIIFFGYACHQQILLSDNSALMIYVCVAMCISVAILLDPASLLINQTIGAFAFCLTAELVRKEGLETEYMLRTVIFALFAAIIGLLFTYVRIEGLVFESEVGVFLSSEDDDFVSGYSDSAWSGRNKYGILSGELTSKRRVFTMIFSLTKDKLTHVRDYNVFGLKAGMDLSAVRDILTGKALDPTSRMRLSKFFDTESMLQAVKSGKKRFSVIAGFNINDYEKMWLDIECVVKNHPISGEYLASLVIEDITEERILMGVLNKIIEQNYDLVMVVEMDHNKTISFRVNRGEEIKGVYGDEYSVEVTRYIKNNVSENDMERAFELMNEKTVEAALEKEKTHEFLLTENGKGDGRNVRKKLFQYSYLDQAHNFMCVIQQDVTDVIVKEDEAKARLSEALREKETAMNAQSEFMTRMSHEMRTPMNAILGLSTLMYDEINNPNVMRDYISKLQYSGRFLLQLINDVLDMTKMEQNKLQINRVPYTFGEFWEAIDTMMSPLCMAKKIDFEWRASISSDAVIMTDPLRMTQIFVNLLSNAVKYTPEGGHVTFECKERDLENGMHRDTFIVKDDGIGMSPEFVKRMFEPFAQESKDVNSNLNGTGLGLSIVKRIVDSMGGKIFVDSEKGIGTTFKLVFEFEPGAPAVIESLEVRDEELSGKRILVVEDNDINREIAVAILNKKGILTDVAINGQEAVEQFAGHTPNYYDMILMDIRMPVMSGLTATKRIRAMERDDAATIPIIAMTANAFSKDVQASLDAGLNEHLSKPIDPKILYATIAKYTA